MDLFHNLVFMIMVYGAIYTTDLLFQRFVRIMEKSEARAVIKFLMLQENATEIHRLGTITV